MALEAASDAELHPTREALIVAGEALFAERGMHGVSLREIGAAAGQRNNNVTQYHFGSKEGLVVAIFEYRSAEVNARRLELLNDAEVHGTPYARRQLEAFFVPLAEQIERGNHYVRFLARLRTDGHYAILRGSRDPDLVSAHDRIADTLRRGELDGVPSRLFWNRWSLTIDMGIAALANFERASLTLHEFVAELTDGLAGFVTAPSTSTSIATGATR